MFEEALAADASLTSFASVHEILPNEVVNITSYRLTEHIRA